MRTFIVIPAHNEEKTIGRIVSESSKYGRVIVVNDGSHDDTSNVADKSGAFVLDHKKNSGYGKSLYDGMNLAVSMGADYIVTLDSDGQHEPKDIPKFIMALDDGYDVVVGSRFLGTKQWGTWKRELALKMLGLQLRIFSGLKMSDCQSGYRGYKKEIFTDGKVKLTDFGMGFSVELPIKAHRLGYVFTEVSIKINQPHQIKSFYSVVRQGIGIGWAILKYNIWRRL